MKKILLFTFAFLLASVSVSATTGKKKDKKKKKDATEVVKPVSIVTPSDTTSYAAGYAMASRGLMEFLTRELHVDTAYMADFVRGYNETIAHADDPAFTAYLAGNSIAKQVVDRFIPGMAKELVGTDDSIAAAPFHAGFLAALAGDTAIFKANAAQQLYTSRANAAREERNRVYKKENELWLKSNASKPGVTTMPSGLQYKVLKDGTGATPKATDEVEVVYEGKTIDGKVFDATANHGGAKTDKFRCDRVIKGWTEALTHMKVGSKWEIYIPQELAYGSRDAGQIKPYSTLIFTVELVGITPEKKAEAKSKGK